MGNAEQQIAKLIVEGRQGRLTDLGCPDCRGVLAVEVLGAHSHMHFTCHVGHAFSQESLMEAKEIQVEQALWSTIETYNEINLLCEALEGKARETEASEAADAFAQRAARARQMSRRLCDLLGQDGPTGAPAGNVQT
ncbi:MAG: hypothetical protein WEA34_07550 [Gemmatimonadota bacterium]